MEAFPTAESVDNADFEEQLQIANEIIELRDRIIKEELRKDPFPSSLSEEYMDHLRAQANTFAIAAVQIQHQNQRSREQNP